MKRCSQLIPACLLFSFALVPRGKVYAVGARTERDMRVVKYASYALV